MDGVQVPVRNPFALRECLEVALEVTWPDVGRDQAACLRALVKAIPVKIGSAELALGPGERNALLACAAHFRRSRTWYWLRADLCEALSEVEQQLKR